MGKIHLFLYVASIIILVGMTLLAFYEALALGGWNKLPTITDMLRPWIQSHEPWTYLFAVLAIVATTFFLVHFYIDTN